MALKLLKRVQANRGSALLYEHERLGLVALIKIATADGATPILEVERHPQAMRRELVAHLGSVQERLDLREGRQPERMRDEPSGKPASAKSKARRRLGRVCQGKATGGANG